MRKIKEIERIFSWNLWYNYDREVCPFGDSREQEGGRRYEKNKADSNLGNNGKPVDGQYFSACLCGNNLCGYQHGDMVGLPAVSESGGRAWADERLWGKRQALLQAEKQRDLLRSGAADVFHHEGIHEAGCQWCNGDKMEACNQRV